ncbi:guanylate cyclase soluble subunit beta-2-like [Saccostrea cucullata]|uniref:guanylate cyclase soluble subunit beta-2-like n=1 Tax=Saccostrea cuccullata TaxID=36930 RepID=UPI002ED5BE2A
MFGAFLFEHLRRYGYEELIRNLANNVLEFLQNMDYVQSYLKEEYQDYVMPHFRCDDDSVSDRMILHYFSYRPGYRQIVTGFIREAAKSLYKMELHIDILSTTEETVSSNQHGVREHVTFSIVAKQILDKVNDPPPTFIAQTKKHGEQQILQGDVEAVKKKLEEIKKEFGEEALPVAKYKSSRAKWRAIARISLLSRGFVPNYPEEIPINPRMFIEVFPYHVIFNTSMKVHQSGISIQQLMPSIRIRSSEMKDYFLLRYPRCTDLTYDNIQRFIRSPFILELRRERMQKTWTKRPPLLIKGQMFHLRDKGFVFFVASPYIRAWEDLESRTMRLADLPMWDATRDFLLSDMAFRVGSGQYYGHFFLDNNSLINAGEMMNRMGDDDKDDGNEKEIGNVRTKWIRVQRDLDNERNRNERLYHAFLPRSLALTIQKEELPGAGYYPEVTALFCDVVGFIQLVANCKPSDVLEVLNALYRKFDRLTHVHDTFRVESIGDAYFVVSGTPESQTHHAERIANTALGMLILGNEVASPLYGEKIQLRIGIHTGSLVCGVVNSRLPRFVVMGETAVVASKMESHGEPGKIHISPTTYNAICEKGFKMEPRGQTDLRGLAAMETYFLLGNKKVTNDALVGRPKGGQEVTFIDEKNDVKRKDDMGLNLSGTTYSDIIPFPYK